MCSDVGNTDLRERFLETLSRRMPPSGGDYLSTIHALSENEKEPGRQWLAGIVAQVVGTLEGMLPTLFGSTKG